MYLKKYNNKDTKIHFVGIGGIGMSGIAEILIYLGYQVSGSDILVNDMTKRLCNLGAKIYNYHSFRNVIGSHILVISHAISANNPEVLYAKKINVPILNRSQIISEITKFYYSIMISGTHGKTTITSIISNIYLDSGFDPMIMIGGICKKNNKHIHFGKEKILILEMDESNPSFLHLNPSVLLINNIEDDHIINYGWNILNLRNAFLRFIKKIPEFGKLIICIDDPIVKNLKIHHNINIITYGFNKESDYCIKEYKQNTFGSHILISKKNKNYINIDFQMPGTHNILNVTAAVALASEEGIKRSNIKKSIKNFSGVKRRFEILGNLKFVDRLGKKKSVFVVDDYGHHPSEIDVTIKTAKKIWKNRRIIMIFQPHRYSRTKHLLFKFLNVLSHVDVLLIMKTDAAHESPTLGIDSKILCEYLNKYKGLNPIFVSNKNHIIDILSIFLKNYDLLILQGAGNIRKISKKILKLCKKNYMFIK